MNMTVVIISRRSLEMELLVVWAFVAILAAGLMVGGAPADEELPQSTKLIEDESHPIDDDLLDSIVKEYGENVKQTMDGEIGRLIGELERQPARENKPKRATHSARLNGDDLTRLRRANEQASAEIKTRIELASDRSGALPQWSPGQAAVSLLSAASTRLQAAGNFTRDKMRSLASYAADRAPAKLKRFFKWPSFMSFKTRFHKNYSSIRVELYRQMVYLRNQVLVGVQWVRYLLRRDRYITGATQFSDWTEQEYHDTYRNKAASVAAADEGLGSLSETAKSKLMQVAINSGGENVFGQKLPDAGHKQEESRRPRRKRQVDDEDDSEEDAEYDELNDTEEDGLDLPLEDEDEDGSNEPEMTPDEEFRLLEEFSNANLDDDASDLDEASDLADEALASNTNFTPIDLRETNCIIESEDQANCGNCYAHVMVAAATYYDCMASDNKRLTRFHSRFTSDCGRYLRIYNNKKPATILGCNGGLVSHTFEFAKQVGVQRFGTYQVAKVGTDWKNDTCAYLEPEDMNNSGWRLTSIEQFQRSNMIKLQFGEIDLHLRTVGPVFANMRYWPNFMQFRDGIYDGFEDHPQGGIHSVLIVGHDIDSKGRDYYLIRNSHGISWGENGFFRIYSKSLDYYANLYAGLAPLDYEDD